MVLKILWFQKCYLKTWGLSYEHSKQGPNNGSFLVDQFLQSLLSKAQVTLSARNLFGEL